MTEVAVLKAERLSVAYGDKVVVRDLSFEIARGRCLGVIGESGAGKTQTFLAMMGLLPSTARVAGSALLEGIQLMGEGGAALRGRRVAMIFQDPMTALTPHLTIGRQIAEPLTIHRRMSRAAARDETAQLLAQVGIDEVPRRLDQYPHELSGGMRQRVVIAMALASDPALLIADEPTTALDVSVQAQLLALIRKLMHERGLALAVVTHDMGVIAALADDVIVMREGEVVEQGPVDRILGSAAHIYTRSLIAATPRLDAPGPVAGRGAGSNAALRVHELTVTHRARSRWMKRARAFAAVDAVSLELAPAEAFGIVGESGCGKSTLARALLRLIPASAGKIVWLGSSVEAAEGEELRALRASMQLVFQDPFASLDPSMRVADIVAEPLRALRPEMNGAEREAHVARTLERMGLGGEYLRRRSRELSGGQCQRVAIARAMVLEPKLLVCDEAVSALDVSIQAQLLDLFSAIKRDLGTSILFVSHNLAVVRRLCERVFVMYLGREAESGPTERVFTAPRHPYTRLLLDSVPLLDPSRERARLDSLSPSGEPASAVSRPTGCAFRTRCPEARDTCAARRPEPETVEEHHRVTCSRWREIVNEP